MIPLPVSFANDSCIWLYYTYRRGGSLFSYFILFMWGFPGTRVSPAFKAGLSAVSGGPVDNEGDEHTTHQEADERENRAGSWWFPIGWSTYYQYRNRNGSTRSCYKQGSPENRPDTFHSTQQDKTQHHKEASFCEVPGQKGSVI